MPQGNLMGINTAIYSRSGGSLGIGFAIPATTARQVMEGLIKDGSITRGWIGVEPRDLTPEIAETFNLPIKEGVLITGVLQNGPAGEGGIRPGDVVTHVGDAQVRNTSQLLTAVAALKPRAQRGDHGAARQRQARSERHGGPAPAAPNCRAAEPGRRRPAARLWPRISPIPGPRAPGCAA